MDGKPSLEEQMKILTIDNDTLQLTKQPAIIKLLNNEPILYSGKIKKINENQWIQERVFIVTAENIFNVHKSKVKRQIPFKTIKGLSQNAMN